MPYQFHRKQLENVAPNISTIGVIHDELASKLHIFTTYNNLA